MFYVFVSLYIEGTTRHLERQNFEANPVVGPLTVHAAGYWLYVFHEMWGRRSFHDDFLCFENFDMVFKGNVRVEIISWWLISFVLKMLIWYVFQGEYEGGDHVMMIAFVSEILIWLSRGMWGWRSCHDDCLCFGNCDMAFKGNVRVEIMEILIWLSRGMWGWRSFHEDFFCFENFDVVFKGNVRVETVSWWLPLFRKFWYGFKRESNFDMVFKRSFL